MAESGFDQRELRSALGRFATGVTIVTAKTEDGTYVGVTVSSFNTVSLEPPLVLWSLDRRSGTLPVFESASHFAVSVLGVEQIELSNTFASRDDDKFDGVECDEGAGGAPLIPGSLATFQCRNAHRHDGGDHVIFVGEVEAFERRDGDALLFHDGAYCVTSPHASGGD